MRVSYVPSYYAPIPEDHIFPMGKFTGLHRYLLDKEIIAPGNIVAPSPVDMTNLLTVHTNNYAEGILEGTLDRKKIRRLGLPWSRRLALRSRLAVQ